MLFGCQVHKTVARILCSAAGLKAGGAAKNGFGCGQCSSGVIHFSNAACIAGAQDGGAHPAAGREAGGAAVSGGPAHVRVRHRRHPRKVLCQIGFCAWPAAGAVPQFAQTQPPALPPACNPAGQPAVRVADCRDSPAWSIVVPFRWPECAAAELCHVPQVASGSCKDPQLPAQLNFNFEPAESRASRAVAAAMRGWSMRL